MSKSLTQLFREQQRLGNAYPSKGCSQENLVATGGAGLIYCFAAQ